MAVGGRRLATSCGCDRYDGVMPAIPAASPASETVDREQIHRLLYDYGYYLDMNMTEELLELFVADCVVIYGKSYGANGKAEYAAVLATVDDYYSATSHHISNTVIDFESADRARCRSTVFAWHRYHRLRADGLIYGQYHDVVVRTTDGWRFGRRELKVAGTDSFHVKDNVPIGRRGRSTTTGDG
jgi:3-phenylpropionate/cinnamic acid dioxygenase small subunit